MSPNLGNREWYFHNLEYVVNDYVSVALICLKFGPSSLFEDYHDFHGYQPSQGNFLM